TVSDFGVFLGRTLAGAEAAQAEAVLVGVSAWARAVAGQGWPAAPASVPEDVQAVVKLAARRMLSQLKREDGVKSEDMGPFGVTYSDSPGDVFLPGELAILRRFRTKSGLSVIGSSRGELTRYDDWWETDNPFLPEWVDQFSRGFWG
ncbi:hypothetical protein BKG58_01250, partial [Mycobacteroides abscessus subsp. abscessus]